MPSKPRVIFIAREWLCELWTWAAMIICAQCSNFGTTNYSPFLLLISVDSLSGSTGLHCFYCLLQVLKFHIFRFHLNKLAWWNELNEQILYRFLLFSVYYFSFNHNDMLSKYTKSKRMYIEHNQWTATKIGYRWFGRWRKDGGTRAIGIGQHPIQTWSWF